MAQQHSVARKAGLAPRRAKTLGLGRALGVGLGLAAMAPMPARAGSLTTILAHLTQRTGNVPVGRPAVLADGTVLVCLYYGDHLHYGRIAALTPPSAPGAAWQFTPVHDFTDYAQGDGPNCGLAQGPDGALYGTTGGGGASGMGTIFRLTPGSSGPGAWGFEKLLDFSGSNGATPRGDLSIDAGGAIYGATTLGGAGDAGTIYRFVPAPAGSAGPVQFATLHSFDGSDGRLPGPVILDSTGTLYGVTTDTGTAAQGHVFALTPPASGQSGWAYASLHSFAGSDGSSPDGRLLRWRGTLLGTAETGGKYGQGTVFRLIPGGGSWRLQTLINFSGPDGRLPLGGLVRRGDVFFGTTYGGGANYLPARNRYGNGVVFALSAPRAAGAPWTQSVSAGLPGGSGNLLGPLGMDKAGGLYAVTTPGNGPAVGGIVVRITP